jgi:hypothetical protein
MSGMPPDFRPLRALAEAHGWLVTKTHGGAHWRWRSPDGVTTLVTPVSSVSSSGVARHRSLLRKAGLAVPEGAGKGRARTARAATRRRPGEPVLDVLGPGHGYITMEGITMAFDSRGVWPSGGVVPTAGQIRRAGEFLAALEEVPS